MLSFQGIPVPIPVAIAGAVIACLAFTRYVMSARRGRRGGLCAELREERESLRCVMEALPAQLASAKRSRMAGAETTSLGNDALQQWIDELEADLMQVQLLDSKLPAADTDYAAQPVLELEIRLIEILALSISANRLADKYRIPVQAAIACDPGVPTKSTILEADGAIMAG